MTRMKKLPTKTMTLNLPEREMAALEKLCDEKQMSKTAIMRQAIRLYQSVDAMMKEQNVSSIFQLKDPMPPMRFDPFSVILAEDFKDPSLSTLTPDSKDGAPQ